MRTSARIPRMNQPVPARTSAKKGPAPQSRKATGGQAVERTLGASTRKVAADSPADSSRFAYNFSRVPAHSPDDQTVRDAASQGILGGGGSLPHLGQIQTSFGRHDVSRVQAHRDSRAAAASLAIGARAYTTGNHVAFAGTPDLHTAAHEAAHAVQQRAGVGLPGDVGQIGDAYERHADAVAVHVVGGRSAEALLDQMAPAGSRALAIQRQVVQRAPIVTDFGEFDTTKYDKVGPAGSEYGVDIEMTFDPDRTKADAKKIGLTQALRAQLGGVDAAMSPTVANRMVPSGTGKGTYIDRSTSGAYGNPLYPAGVPGTTDKLGDTATVAGWGQHGWNYKDSGGAMQHQQAILKDTPSRPGRGNNSSQTFETTALAVEGTQSGTYMGSVTWGWKVDGAGKFTQLPFALKSKGKPSAAFVAAAKQWNKTSTAGTIKTQAAKTTVYDAAFSPAFKVDKGTEVEITGGMIHNNLIYSAVTIQSGTEIGNSGNIKVTDLKDVGGGNPVIKLPIP